MESLLPNPLSRMSRRRRNLLLACCALGAGGYASYRLYTSPSVKRKRQHLYRFFHSLSSLLDGAAQGGDCLGLLWKDLHSFLLSNQDEVPQSVKQLFKVGQTREFQTSVALLCKSVTQGVVSSFTVHGGGDYGSALFEELSSHQSGRNSEKSARELGHLESTGGKRSRMERRRQSLEGSNRSQFKDAGEDEYRRGKSVQSECASRGTEDEGEPDATGRDRASSRSWASSPETCGTAGRGMSRCRVDRRESAESRAEGLSERLVGRIFSEAGRGFASVVVASATRSLVLSVLEGMRGMDSVGEASRSGSVGLEASKSNDGAGEEALKKPIRSPSFSSSESSQGGILNFLCSRRGKLLIADCIETFIGTAVSVYLDKTRDVNVYEEIVSSVSNPAHRDSVKDLLTSVCNGALETLIRESRELLTGSASSSSSAPQQNAAEPTQSGPVRRPDVRRLTFSLGKSSCFNQLDHGDLGDSGECGQCEGGNDSFVSGSPPPWSPDSHDSESLSLCGLRSTRIAFDCSPESGKKIPLNDLEKSEAPTLFSPSYRQINGKTPVLFPSKSTEPSQGWIDGISRMLAVPSNRTLMLDVAGTVTTEAVRSTIDVMLSKVSLTLRGGKTEKGSELESTPGPSKGLRVFNKTGELAQLSASKALVAMTMCLAICLHTLLIQSTILEHT